MEENGINIYKYNPNWENCYEKQVERLKEKLPASFKVRFMHVGSTAIPECYTSGNLDIALGVDNPLDLITVRDVLAVNGYRFQPSLSKLHHYVMTRGINGTLTVMIRIVRTESQDWQDMYIFKDFLLRHNNARDRYSELRYDLSKIPNYPREEYEKEKRRFQHNILANVK